MRCGWRWFGENDAISLREIRQAHVTDVVTSFYEQPVGAVWPMKRIREVAKVCRDNGMVWSVVESVPVHEDIKKRAGDFGKYIENYKVNLRNLARAGVKTVCYNFMPVHDWARTNLHLELPDGSEVLEYNADEVCAFELFVLKRSGAVRDYDAKTRARATRLWKRATATTRRRITRALLLGLPGTTDDANPAGLRRELAAYAEIDGATLKKHLFLFLNEISSVLEETGIDIAIHPDDPPFPIFGIPRVVSCAADIREMVRACPSKHVGVTLCTGSLGANPKNDCVKIFREFHDRIHFCHFRNLEFGERGMGKGERGKGNGERGMGGLVFRESDSHLVGNTDMPALMLELLKEEKRRGRDIVVRPDHGRKLDIDKGRTCYYGYDYGGRLVGLSELRGLEAGIRFMLPSCLTRRRGVGSR